VPIGCLVRCVSGEVGRVKEAYAETGWNPLGIRVVLEDGTACRAEEVLELVKPVELELKEKINSPESDSLEFKASFASPLESKEKIMDEYKIKNEQAYEAWFKQKSPELMHVVMKTIAAFANTDGGTLFIGIEDRTKKILGLQADYDNLKVDDDGLIIEIKNQFKHFFGEELYATILSLNSDLTIYPYEGKEICRIDVTPSRTTAIPVKHFKSKLDEFYIRHSNSSELVPSARHFYEDHWNPRMKKYLSTNLT
jgi:uncharacterized protein YwbE